MHILVKTCSAQMKIGFISRPVGWCLCNYGFCLPKCKSQSQSKQAVSHGLEFQLLETLRADSVNHIT